MKVKLIGLAIGLAIILILTLIIIITKGWYLEREGRLFHKD